jgi:hypothetical protein
MYKSNVFYQQFEIFITVSVFKNVNFDKPNWFVSLLFPVPEESQASTALQFHRWKLGFPRGEEIEGTPIWFKKKVTL